MTQFRNGYDSNLEAYCMKNYGLGQSQSDSFSSLAAPRIATVFLQNLETVSPSVYSIYILSIFLNRYI